MYFQLDLQLISSGNEGSCTPLYLMFSCDTQTGKPSPVPQNNGCSLSAHLLTATYADQRSERSPILAGFNLNCREREYKTIDEALQEMKRNYDYVCRHRVKLEHDIQVTTHEKNILDRQLTETQVRWISQNKSMSELICNTYL